ncbi:MAG: type II secretion system protein GspM, partial [Luteimonas sp.]
MRQAIPDRERWAALGILAALLTVAYLLLIHPWWTAPMLELDDRVESLQQRDLRIRMELQQAPQVQRQLQAVQAQAARVPGFMSERSPELATAALVQRLETAVVEASPGNKSCAITNRSPLSDARAQQGFPRVIVQVRLRCGNPELAAVLYSLESGSPRLFVDNLNIVMQRYFFAGGQGGQGAGLDVSFDLYGYLQSPPV